MLFLQEHDKLRKKKGFVQYTSSPIRHLDNWLLLFKSLN